MDGHECFHEEEDIMQVVQMNSLILSCVVMLYFTQFMKHFGVALHDSSHDLMQ